MSCQHNYWVKKEYSSEMTCADSNVIEVSNLYVRQASLHIILKLNQWNSNRRAIAGSCGRLGENI